MSDALDVSVVVPTYNEAENLPVLVPRICAVLEGAGLRGEVIIVDDASPDGSAEVGRQLAQDLPVRVVERRDERGLATAVLAGFAASDATVVLVMDADGSHPVDQLPAMICPVLEDCADLTVGSRWVAGGGVQDWPWHRRLISSAASRLAAGLSDLSDPTSGLLAIRRELLGGLELDPIGWKIVLEVVVKARGRRVLEIPITFSERALGNSKLDLGVQVQYLRHLIRLHEYRRPGIVEFAKFCLVGSLGVVVDMLTVIALKESLGLDTRLCAAVGFSLAVTSNYLFNRHWTFRAGSAEPLLGSYLAFVATCCVGLLVRLAVMHGLIEYAAMDAGRWYILTNFVGIVVATGVNFTGAKLFAFSSAKGARKG